MNFDQRNKSVVIFILAFTSFFFLFPFLFIMLIDGFSVIFIIPFILMLFFGILVFLVFRLNTLGRNQKLSNHIQSSRCTQCGKTIASDYKFCPHCGMEQLDYIVCEYCGHHNNKQNLQCEECNGLIR